MVEAPSDNRKVYGFGLVDLRDGWSDVRVTPGRTAADVLRHIGSPIAPDKDQDAPLLLAQAA